MLQKGQEGEAREKVTKRVSFGMALMLVEVVHCAIWPLVVASIGLAIRKLAVMQEAVEGGMAVLPVYQSASRNSVERVDEVHCTVLYALFSTVSSGVLYFPSLFYDSVWVLLKCPLCDILRDHRAGQHNTCDNPRGSRHLASLQNCTTVRRALHNCARQNHDHY
jgi:hypothetical protein